MSLGSGLTPMTVIQMCVDSVILQIHKVYESHESSPGENAELDALGAEATHLKEVIDDYAKTFPTIVPKS